MLTTKVHILKCQSMYNVLRPKHCCRINIKTVLSAEISLCISLDSHRQTAPPTVVQLIQQ